MPTTDWKDQHANAASASIKHELVEGVIEEYLDNLGIEDKGLPAYGIRKVAHYAAMVARADALGFDPNLLRNTPAELRESAWASAYGHQRTHASQQNGSE